MRTKRVGGGEEGRPSKRAREIAEKSMHPKSPFHEFLEQGHIPQSYTPPPNDKLSKAVIEAILNQTPIPVNWRFAELLTESEYDLYEDESPDYLPRTPLSIAVACGNKTAVELFAAQPDIDEIIEDGGFKFTALQSAKALGHSEIVDILRANGALDDPSCYNLDPTYPLVKIE